MHSFSVESHADTTGMSPGYWPGPSQQYIFVSHGNSLTKSFEFTGSSINPTSLERTPSGKPTVLAGCHSRLMETARASFGPLAAATSCAPTIRKGIYRYCPTLPRPGIPALRFTNGPAGVGWSLQLLLQHVQGEVK